MNLQEIKDQVAKEFDLLRITANENIFIERVAKRYATECIKASLEKAYDNANIIREYIADFGNRTSSKQIDKEKFFSTKDTFYQIDKPSITNDDNIVLLV